MKVKKLRSTATLPTKAHAGDLGYDLYCSDTITVRSGEVKLIPTGISIQFPEGYGGIIKDRSSIATKTNLFTVAGVIDNGYTGEILIAMRNAADHISYGGSYGRPETIEAGTKIAQLVLIPCTNFEIEEVEDVVSNDGRQEKGFGSSGI